MAEDLTAGAQFARCEGDVRTADPSTGEVDEDFLWAGDGDRCFLDLEVEFVGFISLGSCQLICMERMGRLTTQTAVLCVAGRLMLIEVDAD